MQKNSSSENILRAFRILLAPYIRQFKSCLSMDVERLCRSESNQGGVVDKLSGRALIGGRGDLCGEPLVTRSPILPGRRVPSEPPNGVTWPRPQPSWGLALRQHWPRTY